MAVLQEPAPNDVRIDIRDVAFDYYNGSGPGGQNRNKTANCVRAVHKPTGMEAKCESERSLVQNKAYAMSALSARVQEAHRQRLGAERATARKTQVGTGQRGDKVRTIRMQDGVVTCERTGRKARLKDYLRGELDWLR